MGIMKNQKPDVRPQLMARAFKVHLRTVFRWYQRKLIPSRNGWADRETALRFLQSWKQSCFKKEARTRLGVCATQLRLLIRAGKLRTVFVLGFERIMLSSVSALVAIQQKEAEYYSTVELKEELRGSTKEQIQGWLNTGRLPFVIDAKGKRWVMRSVVASEIAKWDSSCTRREAATQLNVCQRTILREIEKGQLIETIVFGFKRIDQASVNDVISKRQQRLKAKRFPEIVNRAQKLNAILRNQKTIAEQEENTDEEVKELGEEPVDGRKYYDDL